MRAGRDEAWGRRATDAAVLGLVLLVLGVHFPLRLLLAPTITAGGDTPSHYYTLRYLVDSLLPQGRLWGWSPHYYAGCPLLEFYFPLPFLVMAALSAVVSLPVAFKLGTLLGVFGLPLSAYTCLRLLRVPFPGPALGAIGILPFLFSEANSMWGGNIPSVLAGEFAYSMAMALAVVWMGTFYAGITTGRRMALNAVLLALIGLSHAYVLLFAGGLSLCLLVPRQTFAVHLRYVVRMHLHAILLLGVWLLPLVVHLPWATGHDIIWSFSSWKEVLPPILIPQMVLSGVMMGGAIWRLIKRQSPDPVVWYLIAAGGVGFGLYGMGPALGTADIRFVPFVYLMATLLASVGIAHVTQYVRGRWLMPAIALSGTMWWIAAHVSYLPTWIDWNYRGFESKPLWTVYAQVTDRLRGSIQDPRVVFEHSERHGAIGSTRAWESLPLFTGRATLEHVYNQASPSAPFVFYLQSEISEQFACPFSHYGCAAINVTQARQHLELFNVREVLVVSDAMKARLRADEAYQREFAVEPYEVYALKEASRYVTVLPYEPVVWTGERWKQVAYDWFRNGLLNDVHLVFPRRGQRQRLTMRLPSTDRLTQMPKRAIMRTGDVGEVTMSAHEIVFETTALHQPHLVKVSYHPNWRVEGAEGIYLVSPAFMLVYPTQPTVRLSFVQGLPERMGILLSVIGVGFLLLPSWWGVGSIRKTSGAGGTDRLWRLTVVGLGVLVLAGSGLGYAARARAPDRWLARGMRLKDRQQWSRAEAVFRQLRQRLPQAGAAQHAQYYLGIIHEQQHHWDQAVEEFSRLIAEYPESRLADQAYYHLGLCYEALGQMDQVRAISERLQREFAGTPGARYARERWQ